MRDWYVEIDVRKMRSMAISGVSIGPTTVLIGGFAPSGAVCVLPIRLSRHGDLIVDELCGAIRDADLVDLQVMSQTEFDEKRAAHQESARNREQRDMEELKRLIRENPEFAANVLDTHRAKHGE